MSAFAAGSPRLIFRARAKSVPGDLRISWRLSVTLLALGSSRGNRASFVKLHILNDAMRSELARHRLVTALDGRLEFDVCPIRVEPAFSRCLDLMVGKGLAEWVVTSGRLSVQLTTVGVETASAISREGGLLIDEKEFLTTVGRRVTEGLVRGIVAAVRRSVL